MNSSIKYKGGVGSPQAGRDGGTPKSVVTNITVPPPIPPDGKSAPVTFDLRSTPEEIMYYSKKNKEYATRILYTGAAVDDVRRRMAAVFSELCPSGWSYHSTVHLNSGEALMVFERNVA